ncbi:MarR family winged helix-turn-helix transcriptional regulator [Isoptericola aurantiacus]|uniref:MarR family winged helix-turn-helix transcriptional regulator n=1 Tax=Isoptericola aurantiacus TaxID=3377839 RepID=UPI00383AB110
MPTIEESGSPQRAADLPSLVFRAARELRTLDVDPGAGVVLSTTNAQVMRYIETHGSPTPSEIAEANALRRSNVSAALRELTALGFIVRQRDAEDGRSVRVLATHASRANREALHQAWTDSLVEALGSIEDVEQLVRLLNRIITAASERKSAEKPIDNSPELESA